MENKNVVIALALMLAVWLGFNLFFPPSQPPAPSSATPEASSPAAATAATALQPAIAALAPAVSAPPAVVRELTVDTAVYRAVFTSDGGRLKSVRLKNYKETADAGSPQAAVVDAPVSRLATLRTSGAEGFVFAADVPYAVSVPEAVVNVAAGETRQVVFSAVSATGVVLEKIYTLRGDSYDFDLQLRLTNTGSVPVRGALSLALIHPWDEKAETSKFEFVGPATLVGDKVHRDDVKDLLKEARTYGQDAAWSAFVTKYFMGAALPRQGSVEKIRVEKGEGAVVSTLQTPSSALQPGESVSFDYLVYFGPRDLEILKQVGSQLDRAIDYGFFSIIAVPLLHVLKFFYRFVGNYGLSIILLTVIIKLLFWPLTQKSYASMKAMQKLQPEMQRLREKYKDDRDRMNREVMELYKTNRVNPLGGCLPMLVQIPVFFALYKVLLVSIELRHAPFALWITDLSVKDPYYVTPLIMGATMFIQQKMTPSAMDPVQAKLFLIMPVVFTFLFLNFPSGLVIYWLVNNVLTIAQQYFINRKS